MNKKEKAKTKKSDAQKLKEQGIDPEELIDPASAFYKPGADPKYGELYKHWYSDDEDYDDEEYDDFDFSDELDEDWEFFDELDDDEMLDDDYDDEF